MPPPQGLPCGPYCGSGYCASHCFFKNMPPSQLQQWKPPPYSEPPHSSRNPNPSPRPPHYPPGPQHRQPSPGFPHPPMHPPHHHRPPPSNRDPFPPVHRPL